jgi:hypothetical protein
VESDLMRAGGRVATLVACALLIGSKILAATPEDGPELHLRHGVFRPDKPAVAAAPSWFSALPVEPSPHGLRHLVVIAAGPLEPDDRERMEQAGAALLEYLPRYGYRVAVAPGRESSLAALPFVRWVGALPPHFKVEPGLAERAAHPGAPLRIRVVLASGEPATRAIELLAGLAPQAAPAGKDGAWRIVVTLPVDRAAVLLSRLAALDAVEALEPAHPVGALNQDAVWVHQSFVGPSPQETPLYDHGIFGCDQIVGVADSGQDIGSCYFYDSVHGNPPITSCTSVPCGVGVPDAAQRKDLLYYNWSGTPTGDDDTCPTSFFTASGHGTHTSGSVAGDASPYADCVSHATDPRNGGDGQAPGARIVFQEIGDGFEYLNNLGGTLWNIADVAYRSGVRIHSISWGGACHDAFGQCVEECSLTYDSLARDSDLAMWTYPDLLLVQSAGNGNGICSPPDSITTPALAKSSIAVGSVGHATAANTVSSFSSRGPVHDGRIKPTVAAQGEGVVSVASDANAASHNCTLCSLDGTSMSAPTTAGLAALVREYYTAGYYAAGARNASQGFTPSGALIKATLVAGAVPLAAAGPDFASGWGRVLLGSTLPFTGDPFRLWVLDNRQGVTTGSVVTRAFDVAAGEPLRVALVWTDYPAALDAAVARVNELSLEVIDPEGNRWFQTLDPATGTPEQTMNASDPHDARNVEERLVFQAPQAGRWAVRVRGLDVPWGPQPFALVVRGAFTDCPAPASPAAPQLASPADNQVQGSWSVVPGATAYNVYRSLGACPGGTPVQVGSALAGTSLLDTAVPGSTPQSYRVTAASDAAGYCESAPSPCATIVPKGPCTLEPMFAGVATAESADTSGCAVTLGWAQASAPCGADVRYNVYRSTTPGFVPQAANRIARCVGSTSFTDSVGLASGVTYHYVVRAEDGASGGGGPCRGGNEEANAVEIAVVPEGPPGFGTWTDDAGDTAPAKLQLGPSWTVDATGGTSGPKVYRVASSPLLCTDLVSPVIRLDSPGAGPQLSFSTKHDLDYDDGTVFFPGGSLGQVEIARGPDFSNWTRVTLDPPGYPAYAEYLANVCPTTQSIGMYFSAIDLAPSTFSAPLTNWAGGDVKIRFHLSGDLYWPGGNWWIDDVAITHAETGGVCSTLAAGPPPVPDGASVPGQPVRAARSGSQVALTWDAASCPAAAVNVYRGSLGSFASFTGGTCNLPGGAGAATVSMPDNSWFLVVATNGASTDGSYSRDSEGAELSYLGAQAACPAITQHVANNTCP